MNEWPHSCASYDDIFAARHGLSFLKVTNTWFENASSPFGRCLACVIISFGRIAVGYARDYYNAKSMQEHESLWSVLEWQHVIFHNRT